MTNPDHAPQAATVGPHGPSTTVSPLQVALAYHQAWTGGDLDGALAHLAPDVVCDAPAGRLDGLDAFRGFLGPFLRAFVSATMLGAFGDEEHAVIVYDTVTKLAPSAPAAEYLVVRNGLITYDRFIFDRLPFAAARGTAP
jgi:hypothetical protein